MFYAVIKDVDFFNRSGHFHRAKFYNSSAQATAHIQFTELSILLVTSHCISWSLGFFDVIGIKPRRQNVVFPLNYISKWSQLKNQQTTWSDRK